MTDYAKEIEKYKNDPSVDLTDLKKLASMQRDIAVAGSAEDFIRHPFFKSFENKMNDMINDSKGKILTITSLDELKAYQASIAAIIELKGWLNSKVIAGRVAAQAIDLYERDTLTMNDKIQTIVDQAK